MLWHFWIDRGGTFTDVVARAPNGRLFTRKLLSENPRAYPDAAIAGMRAILEDCENLAANAPLPRARIASIRIGTTVATNALLTRSGAQTVLAITAGFKDALRIGTQNRPRLFDLQIVLPEMLYSHVVEIPERVAADGKILVSLDETETRVRLRGAFESGCHAIAIVLMHGYRHTIHEARVAEIAGEIGFTQISVSHAVSPLIKLVSRGDTTVADAYLSPVVRGYVDKVTAATGGARLLFMQSNGGLAEAGHFHGKDAILSGPAGGVVGAAETARAAGLTRIIGFDMGGTSTDVCHIGDGLAAGDYERSLETTVAGIRLRAPMLQIHTVAAGGGSQLIFDGLRFRVGPESAGAAPGPACYGNDGPLCVTDANLLLGKIQADHFPKVFGPTGDQPLDCQIVQAKFAALAERVFAATGRRRSSEELAEGFIALAVDNMAHAVRKISVERGHDVTAYTLACFGGAGGQHVCLVADALGIPRIFIHPLAGVLSAYGIGCAKLRVLKERAIEMPLDSGTLAPIREVLDALKSEVSAALRAQGVAATEIIVQCRVHLRYAGTDTAIAVAAACLEEMTQAFLDAHRAQFGFVMGGRDLICEMAVAEAVGGEATPNIDLLVEKVHAAESASVSLWTSSTRQSAPLYERARLAPGQQIAGPAIIAEQLATTVVEPGWKASVQTDGGLVLDRYQPVRSRPIADAADPLRIEIFNNLFMSIAEQMGAVLQNTAQSVNIKERLDFSCAVFDGDCNLLANAPHMPVHLGSMGESVRSVKSRHPLMADGDVFVLNNPYEGGTHLPDITVVTPVYVENTAAPLFFVASRGHHADVGGVTPGSMPPVSCSLADEGVLLDSLVLVRTGIFQETAIRAALSSGPDPARAVDMNIADLRAQTAANAKGAAALQQVVDQYGRNTVTAYAGHVQDHAEEAVRRAISRLSSGSFTAPMDDGGAIKVAVTVDRIQRTARVDFTGTSPQRPNNFNAPSAVCRAAVLYVFRTLIADDIPMNEGVMRPITLIIPEGSMLHPRFPAAVVAGNVETSQIICDALYGALGVLAASQGTMNNFTFGNDRYQYYETICGGAGAGATFDGASAVHTHMTNSRLTDPEVLEQRFPVRVQNFAIRRGSGGDGKHKGGNGVVRTLVFNERMTAAILSGRRQTRPFGLDGGNPALPGETIVTRADGECHVLGPTEETQLMPGDSVTIRTPGGGGFGGSSP